VDAVWGEEPPRTARKTLQVYVSRLRHLLDDETIEATSHGYTLHSTAHDLDSRRFETLATQGQQLLDTDPATAARLLHRALALWRGLP
jgi:DNA-binding SARP family transcriptional activator